MRNPPSIFDIEYLRAMFYVAGGEVCYREAPYTHGRKAAARERAGCVAPNGYVLVRLDGKIIQAHKIAWALEYNCLPPAGSDVDHIDGNKENNAPSNLRLATRSQNNYNAKKRSDNTSGFKGVSYDARREKWEARLCVEGVTHFVGRFCTAEEAKAAYDQTAYTLRNDYHREG